MTYRLESRFISQYPSMNHVYAQKSKKKRENNINITIGVNFHSYHYVCFSYFSVASKSAAHFVHHLHLLIVFYLCRGTSGIDIDLRRVDIDQCPQRQVAGGVALPLNIFAGTDKCKARTTEVIFKYFPCIHV